MSQRSITSGRPRFGVAVPVGAWDHRLPFTLSSLAGLDEVSVALLDASGDPRVAQAADASGIEFAYRRHGADEGQSAAIQEGWDNLPDAEILAWLNADDFLFKAGLERALDAFATEPGLDVHFSGSTIVNGSGATVGIHPSVFEDPAMLLKGCTISQPSCFVRRAAVDAVGGVDPELHFTMDWDLWARLFLAGRRFRSGDGFASAVFWGDGTKTSSVGLRRMSEIARLTTRLSGPFQAVKAIVGMAVHHGRAMISEHAPSRVTLRPGESLRLPVPNLTHEAAKHLDIAINREGAQLDIMADGATQTPKRAGIRLTFAEHINPGEVVVLSLGVGSPAILLHCSWA